MDIIEKLKRLSVETGSLACLGCGREHNCSVQGCAILREAISEIEKAVWISVEDRLPPDGETRFLIISKWGNVSIGERRSWDPDWLVGGMCLYKDVTHWMTLPKPPEQKLSDHAGTTPHPMTNADRIRAMSDEELAEMLVATTAFDCITCGLYVNNPNKKRNEFDQCLKWLKQPAEKT